MHDWTFAECARSCKNVICLRFVFILNYRHKQKIKIPIGVASNFVTSANLTAP
jgi:hypothetical protein